jgi:AmmeMemoRadiSam system protein B
MENTRKAGNRSKFYPYHSRDIDSMIEKWEMNSADRAIPKSGQSVAIVPHAGYVYSGYTAFLAFRELRNTELKRLIIAGPSHYVGIDGISLADNDTFETPYGNLLIDKDYAHEISNNFPTDHKSKAHFLEHSTENQMPFIKKFFPEINIVELIYGNISSDDLADIFAFVLKDPANGLIISSDLSHFYPESVAKEIDNYCIEALMKMDINLMESSEACGKTGIQAILKYTIEKNLKFTIMDYRTSADTSGDHGRVVGYLSAVAGGG